MSIKASTGDPDRPKFTFEDWGWVVLSVGMGIGAGIAFAPIPVAMSGLWVFLVVAAIGYPGIYVFQQLFLDVMAESEENLSYTAFIYRKLGKMWGGFTGVLYLMMLFIWFFVYSEAVVNDSASYLVSFGVIHQDMSSNPFYATGVVFCLVAVAACGERLLFRLGSVLTISIMATILLLGALMVPEWDVDNLPPAPSLAFFARNGLWLLPFVLTSILFLQSLSPMSVWFRSNSATEQAARYRCRRAHRIAFIILFSVVFLYVMSFCFALTQAEAQHAYTSNISALALLAQVHRGILPRVLGLILEIFAVVTSFFAVYLSLRESLFSIVVTLVKRLRHEGTLPERKVNLLIAGLLIVLSVAMVLSDAPILMFTCICSPIFGIVGCLIPAWIVLQTPALRSQIGFRIFFVVLIGILLCLAPFADYLVRSQSKDNSKAATPQSAS